MNLLQHISSPRVGRSAFFLRLGRLGIGGGILVLSSCSVDLGPRDTYPQRSFGEIVYREVCQRAMYTTTLGARTTDPSLPLDVSGTASLALCLGSAGPAVADPPIASALEAQRCKLVDDINTVVQDPMMAVTCSDTTRSGTPLLDPLDAYLRAIVPLQDDGTVGNLVVRGGALLDQMAQSGEAASALARLSWRDGFRQPQLAAGVQRAALSFPDLSPVLSDLLPILWTSSPTAQDAQGRAASRALLTALKYELSGAVQVKPASDPNRTLAIALRFLLGTSATLSTGHSYPLVLRDFRGVAQLNQTGAVQPPYVDQDADGAADVDASGRFVAASGGVVPAISPFPPLSDTATDLAAARDQQGRALRSKTDATPLYRYIEGDQTVLAALLREGPGLLDPGKDIPLSLVMGAAHLLGPRQDAPIGTSTYSGFNTAQGPLLDLLYGFVQLLGYSSTGAGNGADADRLLLALKALLVQAPGPAARSLGAALTAMDTAKQPAYAAAQLDDTVTLYDDLAPVLVRLVRVPGLVQDLVGALGDKRVAELGGMFGTAMQNRGFVFMGNIDYTAANATTGGVTLPVDRTKVDSDVDNQSYGNPGNNRSVLQRLLHLVHDANSQSFCNKEAASVPLLGDYTACTLFKINDLALYYILTIVGHDIRDNPGDYAQSKTADQTVNFRNSIQSSVLRALVLNNGLGDSELNTLISIPGFDRYPVPQAAARLLFMPNNQRSSFQLNSLDLNACGATLRPGTLCCGQNHSWQSDHDGILFALEQIKGPSGNNIYQALFPIVKAFARHDEALPGGQVRNAAKILVDLMAVLHRHWSSKSSRFFGMPYEQQHVGSGVVNYEPLVANLLGQGDLWPSVLAVSPVLSTLSFTDSAGTPTQALPVIAGVLQWFFDPAAARLGGPLVFRDAGRKQALRNDGTPAFSPPKTADPVIQYVLDPALAGAVTPYYVLADAFQKKRARFAQDQAVQQGWQTAVSQTADLLLQSQQSGATYQFADPRIQPVMLALLDLLRGRVQAHAQSGDLGQWVRTDLVASLADSLSGPAFAATADVLTQVHGKPAARTGLQRLLSYLLDPGQVSGMPAPAAFQSILGLSADTLQLLLDDPDLVPLAQVLGPAMDPDSGVVDAALSLTRRAQPHDPQQVLFSLLQNAYRPDAPSGLYPISRMTDAVVEINRSQAGQPGVLGTDLSAADVQAILQASGAFLADKSRGVSRFMDIIQTRNGN